MLRVGVLASHGGSNLQAVLDAIRDDRLDATLVVVISNNAGAGALGRARAAGVPDRHLSGRTHPDPVALDAAIRDELTNHGADVVLLAGYMKKLGPGTLAAFRNRILNVHPALLPKHGGPGMYGIAVHEAVLAAGDEEPGASIHLVEEEYDAGPVIAQKRVAVDPDATPESLRLRVLEAEHTLVVETLQRIAAGTLRLPE